MRLINADGILQKYRSAKYGTYDSDHVLASIENAPTIEAEPIRHGRWIEKTKVHPDLLNESTYNYECSSCGYWDTHGANVEVPYCWHCGAKMDEVTE